MDTVPTNPDSGHSCATGLRKCPPATHLSANLVDLDLRAKTEAEAIQTLAQLFLGNSNVLDLAAFQREVLDRESLCPTATGKGLAFPHARTDSVREIVMAVGRSREGVRFEQCGETAHLIFMIGTPPGKVREYLGLVGRLARLLKMEGVREKLMRATSAEEFLSLLDVKV
jgi:mannitol/fructose-specific phosphotransferase system IIA component (Ntr-type)